MYLGVALNFWYPLMTLFTASRKSFSVTVFLRARIAYIPASVHTLLISAPEENKKYLGQKRKPEQVLIRKDISQNI
jgi:hypothetical protein